MGEVWRAEDSRLGRVVAIKVLPPSVVADVEATARLRREARTAAQLYHPSIATIHSIEQDGDHIFIVEEFVEGESLTAVIKRGGLAEAEICRIARAVADALAEAHAKGIVHRDIKPDNIIVSGNRIKVLDFGIAKQVGVSGASPETFVTQQGMILGTIHYMSPEQALGRTVDGRTDVFSLGVVLYEMATGRRPFAGATITETMTQIIRDEPTEAVLVNPGVSPGMNEIIQHTLRKNPAERFTAADLVTALDAQIGRARTAPYTSAQSNAPTVAATAAAAEPTIRTGPQLKTVQEPAQPRRRSAGPVIIAVIVVVIAAAAAVVAMRHPETKPAATQTVAAKPQPVATPSTTAVSVTAPPDAMIVESTTSPSTAAPMAVPPPVSVKRLEPAPTAATPATGGGGPTPVPAASEPQLEPQPGRLNRADALYTDAMTQFAGGDWMEARKTLHRVLEQDPRYAKAHFRMGEIALFNRNFTFASEELRKALDDPGRLVPREQQLTRVALAIATHNRAECEQLAAEVWQRWPGDPDLTRMRATFPGMFTDLPRERGRRRLRP
jgi:serine/threonine protein kinase